MWITTSWHSGTQSLDGIKPDQVDEVGQRRPISVLVLTFCTIASLALAMPVLAQCFPNWNGVQPNPPAGTRPYVIISGDFNGDSKADIAVASGNSSNLRILLGSGNGTFTLEGSVYNVGGTPTAMVIGDFDQNGKQDIAVSVYNTSSVRIVLGNGDGTFQVVPTSYSVVPGSQPVALAVGDINNDERSDLVVVCDNSSIIATLKGQNNNPSTLFFAASTNLSVVNYRTPRGVVVADFDRDGNQDIAAIRAFSGFSPYVYRVAIFRGVGNGTFQAYLDYPVYSTGSGTGQCAIAVGDFNSDNYPDIAATAGTDPVIRVLINNGSGAFPSATSYSTGLYPSFSSSGLVVADFDNDGMNDVITANYNAGNITILHGTGNGSFVSGGSPAIGSQGTSLSVVDLDGMNGKDIVVANNVNSGGFLNTLSVLLNATSLPEITQQPVNRLVWTNLTTKLTVSATDAQTYQWRFNNSPLSDGNGYAGANTAQLTIGPAAFAHSGSYDCVIGNTCGTVTSAAATLDVLMPCLGDINHDGAFNGLDIQPMIELLLDNQECLPCK